MNDQLAYILEQLKTMEKALEYFKKNTEDELRTELFEIIKVNKLTAEMQRKIVYEVEISGNAEILTLPINLNISSGLYFIRLITAKENLIKKFYY